jgi:Fe-S-cluster containining protein
MDFTAVCKDCRSKCCNEARPPLSRRRAAIISRYLKAKGSGLSLHAGFYSYPEEYSDGYCTLFDQEKGLCRVQTVKPETCIAGPITFDIDRESSVVEWYLKMEKICLLAGVMSRRPTLLEKHLDVSKKEIMSLIEKLPRSELFAILRIEEEDTYKIDEDPLPMDVRLKLEI